MTTTSFPVLTEFSDDREVRDIVNNSIAGKLNNIGTVTLTNSATSTVVADYRVGGDSVVLFEPTTSDAASEIAAGGMYVSARSKHAFTITHASATTTRSFNYVVFG
jgi:hypothetical protein